MKCVDYVNLRCRNVVESTGFGDAVIAYAIGMTGGPQDRPRAGSTRPKPSTPSGEAPVESQEVNSESMTMATAQLTTLNSYRDDYSRQRGWLLHVVGHVWRRVRRAGGKLGGGRRFEYATVLIGTLGVVLGSIVAGSAGSHVLYPDLPVFRRPAELIPKSRGSEAPEQFRQDVPLRIAVAEVLAETFRVLHARVRSLRRRPTPSSTRRGCRRRGACAATRAGSRGTPASAPSPRSRSRCRCGTTGAIGVAERILALERIAVEQMRDVVERRMHVAAMEEVRDRRRERRGPDDLARLLVIEVVIVRTVREDDLRRGRR